MIQRFQRSLRAGRHFHWRNGAKEILRAPRAPVRLPQHVKAERSATLGQKVASWCGIAIVLLYFLRGTVFPWFLHIPYNALILGNIVVLVAATSLAIFGGGNWRWSWVFVLLAFAAGVSQAEQFNNSAQRCLGLLLLVLGVGPVIQNPATVALRAAAWRLVVQGLTLLAGIFVVWYALRLPNYGAGHFSSFMNQCMIAGPFAGMGGAIALVQAMHRRSWQWGLLALLSIIPVLASGSRVATLATTAAYCFILIRRKPVLGIAGGVLFAGTLFLFLSQAGSEQSSSALTGGLANKGAVNTRTDLWASRIAEFKSSPILGIGVAMGTGSGSAVEESGSIRVEPGSSYLAILAMTGLLGTLAFFSALGLLVYGFASTARVAGVEQDILSSVGVFLAVHGVAEGWVLGFGSPLCFLFWLWLGRVGDAAEQPVRVRVTARKRQFKPFRAAQTGVSSQ